MLSEAEFRYHVSVWRKFVSKLLIKLLKVSQVPIHIYIYIYIYRELNKADHCAGLGRKRSSSWIAHNLTHIIENSGYPFLFNGTFDGVVKAGTVGCGFFFFWASISRDRECNPIWKRIAHACLRCEPNVTVVCTELRGAKGLTRAIRSCIHYKTIRINSDHGVLL